MVWAEASSFGKVNMCVSVRCAQERGVQWRLASLAPAVVLGMDREIAGFARASNAARFFLLKQFYY